MTKAQIKKTYGDYGAMIADNNHEGTEEKIRILADKRENLPPLESWLGKDVPMEELHEMGYSYLEMMELAYSL